MSTPARPDAAAHDTATRGAAPPVAPPLPIAKRLNRNALTVAAVMMGVTVLVAVVTLNTQRPATDTKASAETAIPTEAQPAFLDLPARGPSKTAERPPAVWGHTLDTTAAARAMVASPTPTMPPARDHHAMPRSIASLSDGGAEVYHRALVSPVLARAPTARGGAGSRTAPMADDRHDGDRHDGDRHDREADHDSLEATRGTRALVLPSSPYQLDAGTVIPAALLRAINSELPGPLVAQVTRPVYDSPTQRLLLVPPGTKLIGRYNTAVATGQDRLPIVWTRLIFPDGRRLTVPDADAADPRGATGLPGNVDNHYPRLFGTALLTSIISAAAQLSQSQPSTGAYTAPTAGQTAAAALGQQLSTVGLEVLRNNLNIRPTITLPEGTALTVLLSRDLELPGPYAPARRQTR